MSLPQSATSLHQGIDVAVPIPDPDLEKNKTIQLLEGELPSPINPPSGCVFRTRCPIAGPECAKTRPVLEGSFRHAVSCLKVESALKANKADSCQPLFTPKRLFIPAR